MYRLCCYSCREARKEAREFVSGTDYRIRKEIGTLIVDDRCGLSDEMDSRFPYGPEETIVNCLNVVSDSETVAKIGYWCEESYEEACGLK